MKIVGFSDQHGHVDFNLPDGDLYLCAGDVCPDYYKERTFKQENWLTSKWMQWLGGRRCLATFGNHDFLTKGDTPKSFKVDELIDVGGIKIWFSPWSNTFGRWAWMQPDAVLGADIYSKIPEGVDIIVSHQPPYGLGDLIPDYLAHGNDPHVGSQTLLETIKRVKPQVVLCGHIHNGYGVYEYGETNVINCSVVDEAYERVHDPVVFEVGHE